MESTRPVTPTLMPRWARVMLPFVRIWPTPARIYLRDLSDVRLPWFRGRMARAEWHALRMREIGRARFLLQWTFRPRWRALEELEGWQLEGRFLPPAMIVPFTVAIHRRILLGSFPWSGLFR